MSCIQNPNLNETTQQCEETVVEQSVMKTLMVLDGMNHALDHQEKTMAARAKTLDRKTRNTFIKMKPKVIQPKIEEELELENDNCCETHSRVILRMMFLRILAKILRESNMDDQTLGPQMRPRSNSI